MNQQQVDMLNRVEFHVNAIREIVSAVEKYTDPNAQYFEHEFHPALLTAEREAYMMILKNGKTVLNLSSLDGPEAG